MMRDAFDLDAPMHSITLRQAVVELLNANPGLRRSLERHDLKDEQIFQINIHRCLTVPVVLAKEVLADLIMEEMRNAG